MTFEQAVRKAIKAYMDGKDPTALIETMGEELKYNRQYFDEAEKELLGDNAVVEEDSDEEMTDEDA